MRKHTQSFNFNDDEDNKLNKNVKKIRQISLMAPVDQAFNSNSNNKIKRRNKNEGNESVCTSAHFE